MAHDLTWYSGEEIRDKEVLKDLADIVELQRSHHNINRKNFTFAVDNVHREAQIGKATALGAETS